MRPDPYLTLLAFALAVTSPSPNTYREQVNAGTPALVGCSDTQIAYRGADVGKKCTVTGPSAPNASTVWGCYISGPDEVQLRLCCVSAVCATTSKSYYVYVGSP